MIWKPDFLFEQAFLVREKAFVGLLVSLKSLISLVVRNSFFFCSANGPLHWIYQRTVTSNDWTYTMDDPLPKDTQWWWTTLWRWRTLLHDGRPLMHFPFPLDSQKSRTQRSISFILHMVIGSTRTFPTDGLHTLVLGSIFTAQSQVLLDPESHHVYSISRKVSAGLPFHPQSNVKLQTLKPISHQSIPVRFDLAHHTAFDWAHIGWSYLWGWFTLVGWLISILFGIFVTVVLYGIAAWSQSEWYFLIYGGTCMVSGGGGPNARGTAVVNKKSH